MNEKMRKLVYPSKKKILASLILGGIWLMIAFSFFGDIANKVLGGRDETEKTMVLLFNLLLFTLFFYPLICALGFIYERAVKKTKSDMATTLVAALFLVALNPISFSLISYSSAKINSIYLTEPCGVEITSFTDVNTALYSGLADKDVILEIDGKGIDTIDSLRAALSDKKVGDVVSVRTYRGEYNLTMIDHPEKHFPVIGVQAQQKFCNKYF